MSFLKRLLVCTTPSIVQRAVVRLGRFFAAADQIKDCPQFPSQEASFQTLKTLGWRPLSCIDVGAHQGEWTEMFRAIFPECRVLMVEPQYSKAQILESRARTTNGLVEFASALLGASDGNEVDFNEMETGSSVFAESSPFSRATVRKRVSRLDTVLAEYPRFGSAHCLKIDTQGYELQVLAGAQELLNNVEVVLLEVSLLQVNVGCPLLSEVVAYMAERGFSVFDFCSQIRRRDGVLWQTDLLFLRSDGSVRINPTLTHETWA